MPDQAPSTPPPEVIDVEVVISPQPRNGLSRHLGGIYVGHWKDAWTIAAALRKIADELEKNAT